MIEDVDRSEDPEVRFHAPVEHVRVLDAVWTAAGTDRGVVMRAILKEWAERELHRATLVLRVAHVSASAPESERKGGGK